MFVYFFINTLTLSSVIRILYVSSISKHFILVACLSMRIFHLHLFNFTTNIYFCQWKKGDGEPSPVSQDRSLAIYIVKLPLITDRRGNISLVRKNLRVHEGYFELVEHYEIARGKNMFYFFIIQMK